MGGHITKVKKSIWITLAIAIIVTLLIEKFGLDMKISNYFYSEENGFFLKNKGLVLFLYHYGPIPALGISISSLILYLLGIFISKFRPYKKQALFLVLVMIIGPGILVNAIFKDHWGRPRPKQVEEFGGKLSYRRVWHPGNAQGGRSFPSGHASMGFYFLSFYYLFRKSSKKLAWGFFALGIFAGFSIGLARIIQGAHFFSDVLWSGLFVYITCEILSPILEDRTRL